jgi:hypothetical protein
MLWSEENKVVNVLDPAEVGDESDQTTDKVDIGAAALNIPTITVLAGISKDSASTAIIYSYRTQKAAATQEVGSDVPSALTKVASAGFAISTNVKGGVYIIEVDVREVQAAGAMTYDFDHVCLKLT